MPIQRPFLFGSSCACHLIIGWISIKKKEKKKKVNRIHQTQMASNSEVGTFFSFQSCNLSSAAVLNFRCAQAISDDSAIGGSKLQLYSFFRSSCSWRVRIALHLKGQIRFHLFLLLWNILHRFGQMGPTYWWTWGENIWLIGQSWP